MVNMIFQTIFDFMKNESYAAMENFLLDSIKNQTPHQYHEEQCFTFAFFCSSVMSLLCLFGIFGNILSFLIFTRRCMRSPINVLLAGLCLVDTSVLLIAVPVFVIPGLNSCEFFGSLEGLHVATFFGLYQLGMMSQTCSVWTFVLISIERFLAVCRPLHVQRFLTVRRAKCAQLVLLALAAVYNMARFWEYELVYSYDEILDDESRIGPPVGYSRLLRDNEAYFLGYYTVSFVLLHFLTPFSLITILNAKLVKSIIDAGRVRFALTSGIFGAHGCIDQKRQRQTTRMIVIVTGFFVVCNFLPFVLNVWEAVRPTLFEDDQWSRLAFFTLDVSNVLVVLNSSMNFVIYLLYCRQYKRLFVKYLRIKSKKKKKPPAENRSDNSYEGGQTTTRPTDSRLMTKRFMTTPLLTSSAATRSQWNLAISSEQQSRKKSEQSRVGVMDIRSINKNLLHSPSHYYNAMVHDLKDDVTGEK